MSGRAESLVWERSRAKGSNLLVLIKLGDWANQEGRDAFCGPKALAGAARMSERGVRYVLHKLEQDGEIEIELNVERRELTIGKRTFAPDWFIHVLCVCEWETYQATPKSAKFSSSQFKTGRRRGKTKSEKIAEDSEKISEKSENFAEKAEGSRIAYKEGSVTDPFTDPSIELQTGTAPQSPENEERRESWPCLESPFDNLGVITRLTHEAIDLLGLYSDDLLDTVKALCARHRIAYDSLVVHKAVESAQWQRKHARLA